MLVQRGAANAKRIILFFNRDRLLLNLMRGPSGHKCWLGEPQGISGSELEKYHGDGHICDIADTARSTYSIPIGFGCDTRYSVAGFPLLSFRRVRRASLTHQGAGKYETASGGIIKLSAGDSATGA